jgi:hypothetical protein
MKQKDSMQRIFIKSFLFTVGSVCGLKQFITGARNVAKFSPMTWLNQQPKDFHAAGFDALVRQLMHRY